MFLIPMVGADICGFLSNTTPALCLRWHQLGAFYPFSRNHNVAGARDQDPVSMGPEVVQATRSAFKLRYQLLPYLYTLFYNAHTKGDTVARPLFFEFPKDQRTLSIDEQFLWGPWLLIAPVLKENTNQVTVYLPKGIWYSFNGDRKFNSNGTDVTLPAPNTEIPLLIRGGGILPQQTPAATTTDARRNPFTLTVAPNDQNKAEGELYWDDGDSLRTVEEGRYTLVKFTLEKNKLRSVPVRTSYDTPLVRRVIVFGVANKPRQVNINGIPADYVHDQKTQVLVIADDINLKSPFTVEWT